jgi:hypothetical protein
MPSRRYEETQPAIQQAQVGVQLSAEDRCQRCDSLHFNDQHTIHEEIHPARILEPHFFERERNRFLSFNKMSHTHQIPGENSLIHGFHQSGTKLSMNPESTIQNVSRDLVRIRHYQSFRSRCVRGVKKSYARSWAHP